MATKAADFVGKEGPDAALAAFNAGGDWHDGDLYVFVIDNTGTWRASGARPELVGKNDLNTPDADGKLFVKEIVAIDKGHESTRRSRDLLDAATIAESAVGT